MEIFDSVLMLRYGETKVAKEEVYGEEKNNTNLRCWC